MASRPLPWGGLIVSLGLGPPCDPFRQTGKRPGNPETRRTLRRSQPTVNPGCAHEAMRQDRGFSSNRILVPPTATPPTRLGWQGIGGLKSSVVRWYRKVSFGLPAMPGWRRPPWLPTRFWEQWGPPTFKHTGNPGLPLSGPLALGPVHFGDPPCPNLPERRPMGTAIT